MCYCAMSLEGRYILAIQLRVRAGLLCLSPTTLLIVLMPADNRIDVHSPAVKHASSCLCSTLRGVIETGVDSGARGNFRLGKRTPDFRR